MLNFCNILHKKCALLHTFVNFQLYFCKFLHHFILAHYTHTTHAANQHLFIDQKQTSQPEEPKKTWISPQFLKFKKFHFPIMLICAIYAIGIYAQGILSIAISAVTTNRIFVLLQFKLADAPVAGQFKPKHTQFQSGKCCCVWRLAFLLEIMTNNSYISFLMSGFFRKITFTESKKWPYV